MSINPRRTVASAKQIAQGKRLHARSGTHILYRSIRIALSVIAVASASAFANAIAQDAASSNNGDQQKVTNLKAVVVTGSHIRRVDLETANPVLTVSTEQIKASGAVTLGDLVASLPAMTGAAINPQNHTSGNSHGDTQLSLRGLGPNRTLILVDGHRVASNDVSSIPADMIERVEVLKNGASAVYGSDAIGGVVNFITKKQFQGAQVSVRGGESAHADGRRRAYSITVGQAGDKGSIVAGLAYSKIDGVDENERPYSAYALQLASKNGKPEVSRGGSTNSEYGNIQLPKNSAIAAAFPGCSSHSLARNPGASGMDPIKDYHCYQNSGSNNDQYNYASSTELLTPQERTQAFLLSNYKLSENTSLYADMFATKTRSAFHQAPNTFHTPSVVIAQNNYWNPFGVSFGPEGNFFRGRTVALGNRAIDNTDLVAQFRVGLEGSVLLGDNNWQWEVGMNYGHISTTELSSGSAAEGKLYMGPSFLDAATGKVTCGTPSAPVSDCNASFNPFNMGTAGSMAALQAANVHIPYSSRTGQRIMYAHTNGGLFDLPAGTVQLAVGLDYRKLNYRDQESPLVIADPVTGDCEIGRGCTTSLAGGYNVKSAYYELFVPVLSGVPGAQGLNVTIGDRYSRYSTFGSTNDYEFKVEWRPINDLLLRGSVEDVFRAPNISEEFSPLGYTSPFISSDPCDGYTGNPVDPACLNVPTDGSFRNASVEQGVETSIHSAGAKASGFPIKPESGKSFDIGAVYSPSFAPGLTVGIDTWHVYLKNLVSEISVSNLLNLCSQGETVYCSFIKRFPSGPQQGQLSDETVEPTGNLGSLRVGGTDLSLGYNLATESIGNFGFRLDSTYLKYYDADTAPGVPTFHYAGHYANVGSPQASACPGVAQCLFPRWRSGFLTLWNFHDLSATWNIRYIDKFRMGSPAPSQDTHPAGSGLDGFFIDYGSTTYHDVTLSYEVKPLHSVVTVGINNVFDKLPPIMYENNTNNANTDAMNFDLLGRFYWARWVLKF